MARDLIFEYFCRPMIDPSVQGYNFVNTSVYAAILFLAAIFVVWPFLKSNKIKPDFKFMLSLLPYVVFGSALRVLNDQGILHKTCNPLDLNFLSFTPGIWILTAAIAMLGILVAKKFAKENEFGKWFAGFGLLFAVPVVMFNVTMFVVWDGFLITLGAAIAATFIVKKLVELKYKEFFSDKLNVLVLGGQILDGFATVTATAFYNCGEQHPISEIILGANPFLFPLVKIGIALLLIYFVDSDIKDRNFAGFIKIAVVILGIATGTRDLITLAAGTCL